MFPLLHTKLRLPTLNTVLVQRRHLIARLDAGIHGKLTLICAPTGFGKTTLAAAWLREVNRPIAWVSLDEADNEPARFLRYLLAAFQSIDPQAGAETRGLMQALEPPRPDVLVTVLLNELESISQPFVIAIDNYQVIHTLSIHQLLNAIVEHQPGKMHLVLITREDPPFSLPRLRGKGQISEIRQDDLRFTTEECSEFFKNTAGIKITKNDIAALESRTEGWVAGLQLAAIAIQAQISKQKQVNISPFVEGFTGSNRFVLDYLAEEVFASQLPIVQNFLMKTSILEQLCAPLCDTVTGQAGSQTLLEALEHANLFIIPLDQSRTWYRYHRLFRDLLQNRLHSQPEQEVSTLHSRASSWYEDNDHLPDAIEHALICADWKRALRLLHNTALPLIKQGEIFTLHKWYNTIPKNLLRDDAEACLEIAWVYLLSGQFERAEVYLSRLEELTEHTPPLQGQLFNAQAFLARAQGNLPKMVALSQKSLALLAQEDLDSRCIVSINLALAFWHSGKMDAAQTAVDEILRTGKTTGNRYAVDMAYVHQGMILAVRGKLHDAFDLFQSVVKQADLNGFLRGTVYVYLSLLQYEWNHLEQSWKYLIEADKTNQRILNDELSIYIKMMEARILMASGNHAAAGAALDKAQEKALVGEFSVPVLPRLAAARLQHAIASNHLETAAVWVEHLADGHDFHSFYRFSNITQGLYLLALDQLGEALSHLEKCFERASQGGWVYAMVAIRAVQALASSKEGSVGLTAALDFLKEAMILAKPEGYLRTFIDLGKGMENLLQAAVQRRMIPEYAEIILSAMSKGQPKPDSRRVELVEPIHQRELDVLRLMTAGLTNDQIAEQLVISTGTVKTHVHHICGKLGAHNRTEAASRARELGLI